MAYRRSLGLLVVVLMVLALTFGVSLYTRTAGSASSSSSDGSYVWVGWRGGLIKLSAADGTVASQITGTANVRATAADSEGERIWTYGAGPLSCYGFDGVKTLSLPFPDSDEDGEGDDCRRATLAVDPADHALWIGAGKVLYRLDSSGGVQVSVTLAYSIRTLAFDTPHSLLWVGTRKSLSSYDQNGTLSSSIDLGKRFPVKDISFDALSDTLWVASKEKVRAYSSSGTLKAEAREDKKIEFIAADGEGGVWCASDNRLMRLDSSGTELVDVDPFGRKKHGGITALAVHQADHSVWVIGKKVLAHVGSQGEVLGVSTPQSGSGGNLRAVDISYDAISSTLSITSPADGAYLGTATPTIAFKYSDEGGSGVDTSSLSVKADGAALALTCTHGESSASCTPKAALSEGSISLGASIKDKAGNEASAAPVSFTIDTTSPAITIDSPSDSSLTNKTSQTISGALSEICTLSINGQAVSPGSGNTFSHAATLTEGSNTFTIKAVDRAGNSATKDLRITLDSTAPAAVGTDLVSVGQVQDGQVSVSAGAGSAEAGATITVTNSRTGESATATVASDGSFSLSIAAQAGDSLSISVSDGAGNSSSASALEVSQSIAPAGQNLTEGGFGYAYRDTVPMDATIESYDEKRFSLITGAVKNASGEALSGVGISLLGHSEYGTATTDSQGRFAIPVEGGTYFTAVYTKQGYLTPHCQAYVPWNDFAVADTIAMITRDTASTTITFDGNANTVSTHRSTTVSDTSGARACTLVFTGDNMAYTVDSSGNKTGELSSITVRATEYTTPESMPAKLPPTSAYTYCAELEVDGAERVRFEKPVVAWIENFLGFDVGELVPVGHYDRDQGVWVPEENGQVVRLLDTDGDGVTDAVDAMGSGEPTDLNGDGSFSDEVAGLTDSQKYSPGATFWRSETTHFSPRDWNWSYGLPGDATGPNATQQPSADEQKPEEKDCSKATGSYVEERSRIFHEDIPIPGTGLTPIPVNELSSWS